MPTKLFDESAVDYTDHLIPTVTIPADIKKFITADEQKRLESACLEDYVAAKECLDESIADVASKDVKALEFAGELALRVLTLMDIAANAGLDSRVSAREVNETKLRTVGIAKEAIKARAPDFLKELKKGVLKRIIISGSGEIEKGNLDEAGYVGMNSLAIQHAAEGNLRERMYIPYKSTMDFTEKLLSDTNNVDNINKELKKMGCNWALNKAVIDELKSQTADHSLYQPGAYAASRGDSRTHHPDQHRRHYQNMNPTIQDMNNRRIPLSHRELLAQSGDLNKGSEKKVQWLPGEAWYGVGEQSELHPSLKAASESRENMLTGISGTTDAILTMGLMLVMFDGENKEEKMRDGMIACMGWMIDAKDHTAHEIQTSAKSFGLNYTPGPASYKQIRPSDHQFERDLRDAQQKRGYRMPDEVLNEPHVRKMASDLFPDLVKRKIKQMKIEVRPVLESGETRPSPAGKTPVFKQ